METKYCSCGNILWMSLCNPALTMCEKYHEMPEYSYQRLQSYATGYWGNLLDGQSLAYPPLCFSGQGSGAAVANRVGPGPVGHRELLIWFWVFRVSKAYSAWLFPLPFTRRLCRAFLVLHRFFSTSQVTFWSLFSQGFSERFCASFPFTSKPKVMQQQCSL